MVMSRATIEITIEARVGFHFKGRAGSRQKETVLNRIRAWRSVRNVEAVFPDNKTGPTSRIFYVRVKQKKQIKRVIADLKRIALIEDAFVSPERVACPATPAKIVLHRSKG